MLLWARVSKDKSYLFKTQTETGDSNSVEISGHHILLASYLEDRKSSKAPMIFNFRGKK